MKKLVIGYHQQAKIPQKVDLRKFLVLIVAVLASLLFFFSGQYLMIIWGVCIGSYIVYDIYRTAKISNNLTEHEEKISQYARISTFNCVIEGEKCSFKIGDKGNKVLCSSDIISENDELIRTIVLAMPEEIYVRIRLILREKVYSQVRQIPTEVAVDLWSISQEARARSLGLESPFLETGFE